MNNAEMDLEGLDAHLQSLTRIEREVYELIFRKLGARRGRLDWLMGEVLDELEYNGEMAITACQWLEEHGFVKANLKLVGETVEVEIREVVIREVVIGVWIKNRKVEKKVRMGSVWISPTQKLMPRLCFEP